MGMFRYIIFSVLTIQLMSATLWAGGGPRLDILSAEIAAQAKKAAEEKAAAEAAAKKAAEEKAASDQLAAQRATTSIGRTIVRLLQMALAKSSSERKPTVITIARQFKKNGETTSTTVNADVMQFIQKEYSKDPNGYVVSNILLAVLDLLKFQKTEHEKKIITPPQVGLTGQISQFLIQNPKLEEVEVSLNGELLKLYSYTQNRILFLNPISPTRIASNLQVKIGDQNFGPYPYAVLNIHLMEDPKNNLIQARIVGFDSLKKDQFPLINLYTKKSENIYLTPISSEMDGKKTIIQKIETSTSEILGVGIYPYFLSPMTRVYLEYEKARRDPSKNPWVIPKESSKRLSPHLFVKESFDKMKPYFFKYVLFTNAIADEETSTQENPQGPHCDTSSPEPTNTTEILWPNPLPSSTLTPTIIEVPRKFCGTDVTEKYVLALNRVIQRMEQSNLIGVGRVIGYNWLLQNGGNLDFWPVPNEKLPFESNNFCPTLPDCDLTTTLVHQCIRTGALSDIMFGMAASLLGVYLADSIFGGQVHELVGHVMEGKHVGFDPLGAQAAYAVGETLAQEASKKRKAPADGSSKNITSEDLTDAVGFTEFRSSVSSAMSAGSGGIGGLIDSIFGDPENDGEDSSLLYTSALKWLTLKGKESCAPCPYKARNIMHDFSQEPWK